MDSYVCGINTRSESTLALSDNEGVPESDRNMIIMQKVNSSTLLYLKYYRV